MLLHTNPTRQRGKRTGSLARASGWYMTFFAAGVIAVICPLLSVICPLLSVICPLPSGICHLESSTSCFLFRGSTNFTSELTHDPSRRPSPSQVPMIQP